MVDEELDRALAHHSSRMQNFNNAPGFTVSSTGTTPMDEIQLSSVPDIPISSEDLSNANPNPSMSAGSLQFLFQHRCFKVAHIRNYLI